MLFEWLYEGSSTGRPVHLDAQGRVIFSVAARIPLISIVGYQMLYPDVGVRMRKVGPAFRDSLPVLPMRVLDIWRSVGYHKAAPASLVSLLGGQCIICAKDRSIDEALIHTCSLCLMSYHTRLRALRARQELTFTASFTPLRMHTPTHMPHPSYSWCLIRSLDMPGARKML